VSKISDNSGVKIYKSIILIWAQFGPYHMDRCEALSRHLRDKARVFGLEIAADSDTYAWEKTGNGVSFTKYTLFPNQKFEKTTFPARFFRILKFCWRMRASYVFISTFALAEFFLIALSLRFLGRRVYAMEDSKFDTKQRFPLRELIKAIFYAPYHGVLVSGTRTKNYMHFMRFPNEKIFIGYDTVSIDRVRMLANSPPAPNGVPQSERHFTIISRLVPVKNIPMAIAAYDKYKLLAGSSARDLHICGSGELEDHLRSNVAKRGLSGVRFHGFLPATGVARILATSLALILPSTEEQWGLVVNEAVAMGVPILCSDNVGARDSLVRTGVNGFVFEPDNAEGLAYLMHRLATDEVEWRRFAEASCRIAAEGDVNRFAEGVARAIGTTGPPLG
jgi:glycosyltransferase involved in cell wall biosynthesis